jgi:hypothetical protein
MQTKIGLATIVGKEDLLLKNFIEKNALMNLFDEANFVCSYKDESYSYLQEICKEKENWNVYYRDLNFDFAAQRNYTNSFMKSEYIMRLDVDELLNNELKALIKNFNLTEDFYVVLRKNYVVDKYVSQDWTPFIFKNSSEIVWQNRIHECVFGYKTYQKLDKKKFILIHNKSLERCAVQNSFYYTNWEEQRRIVDRNK